MDLAFLKYVYVLKICMDLWRFIGFMKTGKIFEKCVLNQIHNSKSLRIRLVNLDSQIYEVGFVNLDMNWTFMESGFVTTMRYKSLDSLKESTFSQTSYTFPATLVFPHVWV